MDTRITESAFQTDQQVKKLRWQMERMVVAYTLELGQLLKKIRDDKLYEVLGYQSFLSYLADPEISFGQATAYNAIRIYETFIIKLKLTSQSLVEIPLRRLVDIIPIAEEGTVLDLLEKGKTLSGSDFKMAIGEVKLNKDETKFIPFPEIRRCKACGKLIIEVKPDDICGCS